MVILTRIIQGLLYWGLILFLILYGLPVYSEEVNHNSSDDSHTQFGLPFDFELYGQTVDIARMHTNGVVQFYKIGDQPPNGGHYCCSGEEYGNSSWYQNNYDISYSIMPLWTDIVAWNSGSRQYTENNGTSFTFGWENLRKYNIPSTNTFALTIDDTGSWYVEYDAVDIINHHVTVGSVGDYDAEEWDQFTYRTASQDTTLSDVNGYTGYTAEEEQTIVQQFTSDGICDYTAIEDPDCTTATETFTEESYTTYSDDGSIIDDGQDDGSTTDTYSTVVTEPIIVYQEDYSNNTSETTIASDGQDSGDTLGDTGLEETYEEAASEQSQEVYEEPSTQNESNVVYMENEQVNEPSQEQSSIVVTEEAVATGSQVTPTLNIDPNAALNADSVFASKQRTSSFRRSVNSRALAHLMEVGGLPPIGATSAEQYQSTTSSGSTVNGMLVNQEMANDPSRMYAPANPSNPTGTVIIADASGAMNSNTFDPNQTGMYGIPDNVDNQAMQGIIVASESPMGDEIEFEEALSTADLGGLGINDFKQPKLADQSNWYSDQNSLAQESIYRDQDFYKQQDIYKGVTWYGNN